MKDIVVDISGMTPDVYAMIFEHGLKALERKEHIAKEVKQREAFNLWALQQAKYCWPKARSWLLDRVDKNNERITQLREVT